MPISPRLLFLVAGAIFAVIVLWPGSSRNAVAEARSRVGDDRVILFSAEWCGYCDRLRNAMTHAAIPFAEHDIEASSSAQSAWRSLGGRGVPVTLVDEHVVHGYDPGRVLSLAGANP